MNHAVRDGFHRRVNYHMATGSQLARVARRRALVWRRVPNEPIKVTRRRAL